MSGKQLSDGTQLNSKHVFDLITLVQTVFILDFSSNSSVWKLMADIVIHDSLHSAPINTMTSIFRVISVYYLL